ncbi:MAG TPA: chemotaxis protein CheD [Vicinamibacterales bacterium]|nr:chemotaxis protein CheD [Vicinamibacterales bacterium]
MRGVVDAFAPELSAGRRLVIGIGEFAVSNRPGDVIITHALGSCIAVCVFDPRAGVAGMLHFLLPESSINPDRARCQPGVFADTGIPLLLDAAAQHGLSKKRAIVTLVGGAEMTQQAGSSFATGRRNALAAKNVLWRAGVFVSGQEIGGSGARTLYLSVADGRMEVHNGQTYKEL